MKKHCYGWIHDLPDHRDHMYSAPQVAILPSTVDLRPSCPPVYDQLSLGSCTSNAIAGAIEYDQIKQGKTPFVPSRLFIYYNERAMEGTINSDSGAMIRDGVKSVNKLGVCPESEWPYDPPKFTVKPTAKCYQDALLCKAFSYQRVARVLNQMKGCLASGYPFVFGIAVYESFESDIVAKTGIVPMPSVDEQMLGGHALLAVGYDDTHQRFIVRNSWSESWGDKGYCYISYNYLMNKGLASDFWTIRVVGQ